VRGCARAQVELLPLADGGDGTLEVLLDACGGEEVRVETCDALGRPVSARLALLRGREPLTAVVELAEASGLCRLRPAERNPLLTSTRGFGVLIRAALDRGARRLLLCIGGSATNDGGAGMAAALGYRFFDAHGAPLEPRGDNLASIARIDATNLHAALADAEVLVACDVSNPLLGPRGATAVFAPQKGAVDAADRELLERGLGECAASAPRPPRR
jgi:glycerate kinase